MVSLAVKQQKLHETISILFRLVDWSNQKIFPYCLITCMSPNPKLFLVNSRIAIRILCIIFHGISLCLISMGLRLSMCNMFVVISLIWKAVHFKCSEEEARKMGKRGKKVSTFLLAYSKLSFFVFLISGHRGSMFLFVEQRRKIWANHITICYSAMSLVTSSLFSLIMVWQ